MKKVTVEIVNRHLQIPADVLKRLGESDNMPIRYTKDCPKLTRKQIAQFRPVGDRFLKQKNTKVTTQKPHLSK